MFDPGMNYFAGGIFPVESYMHVTKRVTGSLTWEILRYILYSMINIFHCLFIYYMFVHSCVLVYLDIKY